MQPNDGYEIIVRGNINLNTRKEEMMVQLDGRIRLTDIFQVIRQLMKITLENSCFQITENMFILGLLEVLKDPSQQDIRIDMTEAVKQAAASGRGEDGAD